MFQIKYNRKRDTNKQSNMQEENYNSFQAHTKQNIGNDNDNDDDDDENDDDDDDDDDDDNDKGPKAKLKTKGRICRGFPTALL